MKRGRGKLSEDDVRQVRTMSRRGVKYKEIANQFQISESNVCMIVRRRSWQAVE